MCNHLTFRQQAHRNPSNATVVLGSTVKGIHMYACMHGRTGAHLDIDHDQRDNGVHVRVLSEDCVPRQLQR